MPGRSSMALFTRTAKLEPGAHGARCAWAMAVYHEVGINRQRNSGYRPSRVNIMAQGLFTPDPSLSPTHVSIRRGRATTTHYTHHQVRPQRWHAKGACATRKRRKKEEDDTQIHAFLHIFVANYRSVAKFSLNIVCWGTSHDSHSKFEVILLVY